MIDQESPIDVQSEPLSLDELRAACDSPLHYIAILHRYLDGGLTALPVSAQRLFLQLVRETLARGRDRVRITIRALTEKTGLSKETVSHALRQLSSPSVVNVVDAGGAHSPGQYQIRWYTYQKRTFGKPPQRSRMKVRSRVDNSIENRLLCLSAEDRALLEQSYLALQPKERADVEDTVKDNLLTLGMVVTKDAFHQYVLYETMRRTMYHRIRHHYPTMFSFDPVVKS
jgi:DNA-binding transcriptional ArsR family regulator